MQPTILKLLNQLTVSHDDWQNLFYDIHNIGMWDSNGSDKVFEALKGDICNFIMEANMVNYEIAIID